MIAELVSRTVEPHHRSRKYTWTRIAFKSYRVVFFVWLILRRAVVDGLEYYRCVVLVQSDLYINVPVYLLWVTVSIYEADTRGRYWFWSFTKNHIKLKPRGLCPLYDLLKSVKKPIKVAQETNGDHFWIEIDVEAPRFQFPQTYPIHRHLSNLANCKY